MKRTECETEQVKEVETLEPIKECELKEVERPVYCAPQLFLIDTAARLMKSDLSGHMMDEGSGYVFNS